MRKKLVGLLFFSLLLTGCTVDYKMIVKSDNTIEEKIVISEAIEILEKDYDSLEQAKKSYMVSFRNFIEKNNYKIKYKNDKSNLIATLDKASSSFTSVKSTPFFEQIFGNAKVEVTNHYTSFKTEWYSDDSIVYDGPSASTMLADTLKINIQFHKKVLEQNADSYDKNTNTYTWEINKDTMNKTIYFKIGNQKRYDIIFMYMINKYKYFAIIGVAIGFAVLIIINSIKLRIKMVNRI